MPSEVANILSDRRDMMFCVECDVGCFHRIPLTTGQIMYLYWTAS
jgi:hypothetical protein